ncbi:hypothetical protein ACET3Z_005644 [Daucus carota]
MSSIWRIICYYVLQLNCEGSTPRPRLDIRREMMDADSMLMSDSLEEDDEFETPREHFDSSGKKTAQQPERNSRGSGSSGKHLGIEVTSGRWRIAALNKHDKPRVGSGASNITEGTFFGNYKPRNDILGVVEKYMNKTSNSSHCNDGLLSLTG